MEVVVAGAGSIGLLLGSYLSESGMNVTFYVRRGKQKEVLQREALRRINADGSEYMSTVNAILTIDEAPQDALWILAVKYDGLQDLLQSMDNAGMHNPILFIQNGIGHLELVKNSRFPTISLATVEHGALRLDDCTVQHNGIGNITIAPFRGNQDLVKRLEMAQSIAFPLTFVADAEYILMRKVLLNCMINPLTAILQIENGELLSNQYGHELLVKLYGELMQAFPEMESTLPLEAVKELCKRTGRNRLNGNQMETDTIVSAVIRKARMNGADLPLLETLETMLLAIDCRGAKV